MGFIEGPCVIDDLYPLETCHPDWYRAFRDASREKRLTWTEEQVLLMNQRNLNLSESIYQSIIKHPSVKRFAFFIGDEHLHESGDPTYQACHKDGLSVRQLFTGANSSNGGEVIIHHKSNEREQELTHMIILPKLLDISSSHQIVEIFDHNCF